MEPAAGAKASPREGIWVCHTLQLINIIYILRDETYRGCGSALISLVLHGVSITILSVEIAEMNIRIILGQHQCGLTTFNNVMNSKQEFKIILCVCVCVCVSVCVCRGESSCTPSIPVFRFIPVVKMKSFCYLLFIA